jgi:uncharacterized protein (UPF0333 family)
MELFFDFSSTQLLSLFLLFLVVASAVIAYTVIPRVSTPALMTMSAIALAAGIWWHWTQFAVDYKTSTWQESLRNYASYVMVGLVIIVSYAVYAFFIASDTDVGAYVASATQTIRNTARNATAQLSSSPANLISNFRNILPGESTNTRRFTNILQ